MRIKQSRTGLVAAALVAAVALTACGDAEELAETSTELTDEDRLAQLEAELQDLRSQPDEDGSADGDDRAEDGADGDDSDTEGRDRQASGDAGADDNGSVEPRTVEVAESVTASSGALTVTVERIVIHDHYIEVEVTAYNDHPTAELALWGGSNVQMPMLFDEQDRRFDYQHPAGYSTGQRVEALPGQRLDAVMVFGGSLRPEAQSLTLRFQGLMLEDWELTVPVGQVQP